MNYTNILGHLTELKCQLDFCKMGIVLCQPTNPASRYDFIADINQQLYRIQCKTAHPETNNRISINIKNKNWNSGVYHSYIGEIDYFYTNWNDQGYLIPISLCTETNRQKTLRLGEPEQYIINNDNVLYGKEYEFEKILSSLGVEIKNEVSIEERFKQKPQKKSSMKGENENYCHNCGKIISKNAYLCKECYKITQKNFDMPSREELKTLIRTIPFTKIGEKYGRTDNAIRKWCDKYSLPRKSSDIKKISDDDWVLV